MVHQLLTRRFLLTTLLLTCLVACCWATYAGAVTHVVTQIGFSFVPSSLVIVEGDTVRWEWTAGIHTVTNGTGFADPNAGVLFDAPLNSVNTVFQFQYTSVGSFPYFCRPHEFFGMKGTVFVEAAVTGVGDDPRIPAKKFLLAPHPNPFQSSVVLSFELEKTEEVRIDIFDLSGRRVREFLVGVYDAGRTELTWGGRDDLGRLLGSGIYFVRMETEEGTAARKVFKTR